MVKLFQLYKSVCWALRSTSPESLSVETASSTGGLRTTRELGEITDTCQDFFKSYSPKTKKKTKHIILLNQRLKIALVKQQQLMRVEDFY